MKNLQSFSINCRGVLLDLTVPKIMGILNLTPDSFSDGGKFNDEISALKQTEKMLSEGASIIDIGAQSTRPNATFLTANEEISRLGKIISGIKKEFPQALISLDTFHSEAAYFGYNEGIDIINDISGGLLDRNMFRTVAKTGVPYILMHMQGTPQTMQQAPHYEDFRKEVVLYLAEKVARLHDLGVKDIIIDPGFGFGKTLEQNYELMNHLEELHVFKQPLLVGISRKSMIYKLLETTPEESLNGTTMLHAVSLLKGAHILRVHDVKAAREVVRMYEQMTAV